MTTESVSQSVADLLPFARLLRLELVRSPRIAWKLYCKSARNFAHVRLCCMGGR